MATTTSIQALPLEALLLWVEDAGAASALVRELNALHDRDVISLVDTMLATRPARGPVRVECATRLGPDEAERLRTRIGLERELGREPAPQERVELSGTAAILGGADAAHLARQIAAGEAAVAAVFAHRWVQGLLDVVESSPMRLVEDRLVAGASLWSRPYSGVGGSRAREAGPGAV